jgi:hypothetical protein
MSLPNKILLLWLTAIWTICSLWVFVVTRFPLNFGVVGLESLGGIILMWVMIQYKDI